MLCVDSLEASSKGWLYNQVHELLVKARSMQPSDKKGLGRHQQRLAFRPYPGTRRSPG